MKIIYTKFYDPILFTDREINKINIATIIFNSIFQKFSEKEDLKI